MWYGLVHSQLQRSQHTKHERAATHTDGLGDELADELLQIAGRRLPLHDLNHLLPDGTNLQPDNPLNLDSDNQKLTVVAMFHQQNNGCMIAKEGLTAVVEGKLPRRLVKVNSPG